MASDLITFQEYLDYSGKKTGDLSDEDAVRIAYAISAASQAVRDFTDRKFELAAEAVPGTRTYRYRGKGAVDIDECTAINSITTKATPWAIQRTLDDSEWFALNEQLPIIDYVELYTHFLPTGGSPQMGFTRNLDNYAYVPYPVVMVVDADWGWPEVPQPVKRALLWGTDMFLTDPGEPYTSESIAGYSRSYSQMRAGYGLTPGDITQVLPDRAVALLDPYIRLNV